MRQCVSRDFRAKFAREPECLVCAPGRVNLIGEHVDYNDGFVLPMAIGRYVMIAAAPARGRFSEYVVVHSAEQNETIRIPIAKSSRPTLDGWGRFLEGVVAGFSEQGIDVPAFEAVVASNVPVGAGLSSSAALEVAMATLIEALTGIVLQPIEKALLCQRAEHLFANIPCGIMDQFSSVFGQPDHLMLLDCQSRQCEMVPFDSSNVSVLITDSAVKHELTEGEYASRRTDCENALAKIGKASWRDVTDTDIQGCVALTDIELRRARHVTSEINRSVQAAKETRSSNWELVGNLMYESHASLRDDFAVSCEELDILVETAIEIGTAGGVIGSRMTGGGFGGCTVSLVKNLQIEAVKETLKSVYESRTGLQCYCFSSRPSRGAHVLPESK